MVSPAFWFRPSECRFSWMWVNATFFEIAWYICLYLLLLQSLKTTSSADHMIVITCNNTTINNQHLRKSNIYFVENGCKYKLHYESHIQVFRISWIFPIKSLAFLYKFICVSFQRLLNYYDFTFNQNIRKVLFNMVSRNYI